MYFAWYGGWGDSLLLYVTLLPREGRWTLVLASFPFFNLSVLLPTVQKLVSIPRALLKVQILWLCEFAGALVVLWKFTGIILVRPRVCLLQYWELYRTVCILYPLQITLSRPFDLWSLEAIVHLLCFLANRILTKTLVLSFGRVWSLAKRFEWQLSCQLVTRVIILLRTKGDALYKTVCVVDYFFFFDSLWDLHSVRMLTKSVLLL